MTTAASSVVSTTSTTSPLANLSTIDVTALVSNIMSTEKVQQTNLKTTLSDTQTKLAALQGLKSNVSDLQTSAESIIGSVYNTHPVWSVATVSSTSPTVSATATTSATRGTYDFNVTQLAKPHKVLFGSALMPSDLVADGPVQIVFTNPSSSVTLTPDGGSFSLSSLASAINSSATAGVRAALVGTGDGTYRLQLTAKATGESSQFSLDGATDSNGVTTGLSLGTAVTTTTGQNAKIQFGPDAVNDVATSSSNTFTGTFPGVTFTASAIASNVTLTVNDDVDTMASQVQTLVDSLNTTVSSLATASTYVKATNTAGPLMGVNSVRSLAMSLSNAFVTTTGASVRPLGLSVDKYGVMSFDATAFKAAYSADSTATKASIVNLAKALGKYTNAATKSVNGSLTSDINIKLKSIDQLNTKISDWDVKLAARQALLTQTYSTINANLGTMTTTSNWIADQIKTLTTKSSG